MGEASSPGNTVNDPPPYKSHSNPCFMQMSSGSKREQKCPKKSKFKTNDDDTYYNKAIRRRFATRE